MRSLLSNLLLRAFAAVAIVALPASVLAAECGDDVEGARIACACGDVVVSDVRLEAGDPIAGARCSRDGLLVRAAAGAESITVNLGGVVLTGNGQGVGLRIVNGGSEGAQIVGAGATVSGFRHGVVARGRQVVQSISGLAISENGRSGLVVDTDGASITDIVSRANGAEGVLIAGADVRVSRLLVERNGGPGIRVRGEGHSISVRAGSNDGEAVQSSGQSHTIAVEELR